MPKTDWHERAHKRVANTPELTSYTSTILYDYHEEDHWEWVATAPVSEIVDWAKTVDAGITTYEAQ